MVKTKNLQLLLVFIQIFCIGLIVVTSSYYSLDLISIFCVGIGSTLGLWSVVVMLEGSKLHITATVDARAVLVTTGPYKIIRHPMYSSVLLLCFGLLLTNLTFVRVAVYGALLWDLILKLSLEECLLTDHFEEYRKYKVGTYRLVPFIF
jgi:protein-S-isoprenylcysteine O-methyltransferase Ste14